MRLKTVLALPLFLLLTACAVTSTQEAVKPKEQKGGFMGLVKTDDVTVDSRKAFAGVNRVIIGSFKVGFIESKKEAEKAGMGVGGRSSAEMLLKGLDARTMQAITEQAYADFVAQLQRAGVELVDRSTLTGSAEFAKANREASPFREEASFFGSNNTVTYVAPAAINDIHFFMGEAGKTGGFGFSNPSSAASKFADKNKIPVVSVMYMVDFAGADGSGGRFASTSSLEIGQVISVTPGSGLSLVGGYGGTFNNPNGSLKLGQAVYSPDTYGEVKMTTSGVMKGLEVASNVTSALLGGGTNQHRDFEVVADPARYQRAAGNVLAETNAKLVSTLQSLR